MKTSALEESDVRAIVRLLSVVNGTPGDHLSKKRELMTGLACLIEADRWAWGMAAQMAPDKPSVHLSLVHGGFDEKRYARFSIAYQHPGMAEFHAPFARELAERQSHLTRLRGQFAPDDRYLGSECHRLWLEAGVDDVIMSMRPQGEGLFSIIGLYRDPSRPRFTLRDGKVAHVILAGVPWLHAEGWDGRYTSPVRRLSPRERMTLDLLIQGYTRDEIAGYLEISKHTVNQYAKSVFRHFGVHSQVELIARFKHGDGGDA